MKLGSFISSWNSCISYFSLRSLINSLNYWDFVGLLKSYPGLKESIFLSVSASVFETLIYESRACCWYCLTRFFYSFICSSSLSRICFKKACFYFDFSLWGWPWWLSFSGLSRFFKGEFYWVVEIKPFLLILFFGIIKVDSSTSIPSIDWNLVGDWNLLGEFGDSFWVNVCRYAICFTYFPIAAPIIPYIVVFTSTFFLNPPAFLSLICNWRLMSIPGELRPRAPERCYFNLLWINSFADIRSLYYFAPSAISD